MYGVDNVWSTIKTYMGNVSWMVVFSAAVLFIIVKYKKEDRQKILLFLAVSFLVVYNDVSRSIIGKVTDVARYYRFFWLVPVTIICAFALIAFFGQKIPLSYKIISTVVMFAVLFAFNGTFIDYAANTVIENKYLMSDEIFELQDTFQRDKEVERPVVAMTSDLEVVYRTYDASVVYAIGRTPYLTFGTEGYEGDSARLFQDEAALARVVNDGEQIDRTEFVAAIQNKELNYLVTYSIYNLNEYLGEIGCELLKDTGSYQIYRVRLPENLEDQKLEFSIASLSAAGIDTEPVEVIIPGLKEEYHFLCLADLHIIMEDDEISPAELETVQSRKRWSSVSSDITAADYWSSLPEILDSCNADAVLLGGDMLDFCSASNVNCLKEGLERLRTPYLYVRADHDSMPYYCEKLTTEKCNDLHADIDGNEEILCMEFPEICIVGINNNTSQISPAGLEQIRNIFISEKPVILLAHVPYDSTLDTSLQEASKAVWQDRALVWGKGCYYQPDADTGEFMELIIGADSPVKEILCGHLHFGWADYVAENVHESVFSPAFEKKIGVITVKGR